MNVFCARIIIHLLLLRPFIKLLFGVNLIGKENMFGLNKYIIIANHNSHLDILLLFYLLPVKHIMRTHPVAAEEYFSKPKILFHLVNYLFRPIWVKREDPASRVGCVNEIKGKLSKGHNIIIFPEGTRGVPGEIQTFKGGVGRIAEQFPHIPIVPIYISGTERSFPKNGYIPVPIWNNVIIGPPQVFRETYEKTTRTLENIILEFAAKEIASRHKRKLKKRSVARTIAVLGIDGSGKSTLSENLSKILSDEFSIGLVSDKLSFFEHNQLKHVQPFITENIRYMVGRYAKNAKSLKLYKIPKLTELILRDILLIEIKKWYNPDLIILDGSPLLNLSAWAVLYKEEFFNEDVLLKAIRILSSRNQGIHNDDRIYKDLPELSALKKLGLTHLNLPDLVIFLDVDPQIAIERIEKRGQKKQVHETFEKLSKLRSAYLQTCKVVQGNLNIPTYILPGNDSIENITNAAVKFTQSNFKMSKEL